MSNLRSLLIAISLMVASSTAFCLSAPLPASDTPAVASLKARGMPGAPPVIQSIIGSEFGAIQPGATAVPTAASETPSAAADARKVSYLVGQKMQYIRNQLLQSQTGLAAARTTRPSADSAGMLVDTPSPGAPPPPAPRLSDTTARVQAGTQTIGTSEEFSKQALSLDKKYQEVVKDVLIIAAIHAASSAVDNYTPEMVNAQNVKEVLKNVLGAGAVNVPPEVVQALGTLTQSDVANAPYQVVADAIRQYATNRADDQLGAVEGQLRDYVSTSGASVAKDVTEVRTLIDENSTALSNLSDQLSNETDALKKQTASEADETSVSADEIAMRPDDASLWAQLSPREKLTALDEGAFANSGVDTGKLRSSLAETSKILDARDEALGAVAAVGKLGTLAASLGVPIDTYNLTRNVDTASTAINVAASIATGNWMGALSAGVGLLGGGPGPDPTAVELSAISQKLDTVIALQQQTLQKLDDLSRQLQASTITIMTELNRLQRMVASVLVFEEQDAQTNLWDCETFITKAGDDYGMKDGIFSSFEARRNHFSNEWHSKEQFTSCMTYLAQVKDVKQRQGRGGVHFLNTVFLANSPETQPAADGYQNMLYHTLHLLGSQNLDSKPNCSRRLTWAAAMGVRYFSDLNVDELACGTVNDADISAQALHCAFGAENLARGAAANAQTECELLRYSNRNAGGSGSRESDYIYALKTSVVPENVKELGGILLFMTPYESLLKKNEAGQPEMLTDEELAAEPSQDRLVNDDLYEWPNDFLNVVNIAIAQQAISAGSLATDATARLLRDSHYGASAKFPVGDPSSPPSQSGATVPDPGAADPNIPNETEAQKDALRQFSGKGHFIGADFPALYNYTATLSLFKSNPTYAVNFMRYLVTKRLSQNGVSRPEYMLGLKSENIHFISTMLRDAVTQDYLPLEYLNKPTQKGWHLALRNADGSNYYLPLPSVTAVWANSVAYMSQAPGLFALRDALLDRIILSAPDTVGAIESVDLSAKRLLRLEAMGDRKVGETRLPLELFVTRGRRAVVCDQTECTDSMTALQSISVSPGKRRSH